MNRRGFLGALAAIVATRKIKLEPKPPVLDKVFVMPYGITYYEMFDHTSKHRTIQVSEVTKYYHQPAPTSDK